MDLFEQCFAIVVGTEAGLSLVAADPGNWTGGAVSRGKLNGTKYGVSAAAFPALDIRNLSLPQAHAIYRTLYWDHVLGDRLPPSLALIVLDTAVNGGVSAASRLLQAALGVTVDGVLGAETIGSLAGIHDLDGVCAEFLARRLLLMASLPTWATFGLGWSRRVCRLPYQAALLQSTTAKALS